MAELSAAGKRAAALYQARQVPHEVSRPARPPGGKGYVGECSCGFETKGPRAMDVRANIDEHLAEADPDQLVQRIADEAMKPIDRALKTLKTQEERNDLLLHAIKTFAEALAQDYKLGLWKPTYRDRKKIEMMQLALDLYRGESTPEQTKVAKLEARIAELEAERAGIAELEAELRSV